MPDLIVSEDPGGTIVVVDDASTDTDIVVIEPVESGYVAVSDAIPGPSAYQVALQNGFVGTEAEWLASLRPTGFNRQHIFSGINTAEVRDYIGGLPLTSAGNLREIWMTVGTSPAGGSLSLQLKKDGVAFGPVLSVPAGQLEASVTGLSAAYAAGEQITVSFTSVGTTPATGVTVLIVIEDD